MQNQTTQSQNKKMKNTNSLFELSKVSKVIQDSIGGADDDVKNLMNPYHF